MTTGAILLQLTLTLAVQASYHPADPDMLHVQPLYGRRAGYFSDLKMAFLEDGRAIAAVRCSQILSTYVSGRSMMVLPLVSTHVIYVTTSNADGSDWSFPTPAPRALPGWQGPPGLARSPDGYVYLTWMYGGGGRTRAGAFWSRTRDGSKWSRPAPITVEGRHLRGVGFGRPLHVLDLAFTIDGTGWLIGQSAGSKELRVAFCEADRFGDFGRLERLGEVPWSEPRLIDLDSTTRFAPRLLATRWYGGEEQHAVLLSADESSLTWSVDPVPLTQREDAIHQDAFGGWFTYSAAAPLIGGETPGVIFSTRVDRLKQAAAWTSLGETWQLPQLIALEGHPPGQSIWYVMGGRLRGHAIGQEGRRSKYRSRVSLIDGGSWPPSGLAIHQREPVQLPETPPEPEDFVIRLPLDGFRLKLPEYEGALFEEFHRPLLVAATVRPEELAGEIRWFLNGQPSGFGPVVSIDVRTEGPHVIEAACGSERRSVTISAHLESVFQVVGGFSVTTGTVSEDRDDTIVDLRLVE